MVPIGIVRGDPQAGEVVLGRGAVGARTWNSGLRLPWRLSVVADQFLQRNPLVAADRVHGVPRLAQGLGQRVARVHTQS